MSTQSAEPRQFSLIAVAGLGLLGGSIALAVRQRRLADRIVGIGRRPDDLEAARGAGLIDQWATDPSEVLPKADLVVLCQPVEVIVRDLPEFSRLSGSRTLLTDVGSTKTDIVRTADTAKAQNFAGSHPMAGSDCVGWRNSSADLFDGASTWVTSTDDTELATAAQIGCFWESLGSRVIHSSPQRHDRMVALLSHVPHLAAVALIDQIYHEGEDPAILRLLCGAGLRDTTRVAKGSPELWEQICRQNSSAVSGVLKDVGERFHRLAEMVEEDDLHSLRDVLDRARDLRKRLD